MPHPPLSLPFLRIWPRGRQAPHRSLVQMSSPNRRHRHRSREFKPNSTYFLKCSREGRVPLHYLPFHPRWLGQQASTVHLPISSLLNCSTTNSRALASRDMSPLRRYLPNPRPRPRPSLLLANIHLHRPAHSIKPDPILSTSRAPYRCPFHQMTQERRPHLRNPSRMVAPHQTGSPNRRLLPRRNRSRNLRRPLT